MTLQDYNTEIQIKELGKNILLEYINIEQKKLKNYSMDYKSNDFEHFGRMNVKWILKLKEQQNKGEELSVSLNRINYLGKKTRALLKVLGIKEPRTLKELQDIFRIK